MSNLMETYKRLPVAFARGAGAYLEDTDGKKYLDALTGIAVCGLGHAHPNVTRAIADQAGALMHTSNLYEIPLQTSLAEKLCARSGMDKVFFGNSGAEANEAAIKIARLHGHNQGIEKPTVVVMEGSFHGRTMATLTATGNRKVQAGFEPLLKGFVRAPFGDADAVALIAKNNPDVTAVLVEPVLGEGGVIIPADDYLARLRAICDEHNWLLMLDEVQTGNGRTGAYFAYQKADILPDVVTTAKGLGNGVPIGACLARGHAADILQPGNHGSTFGGNPLVCAAAHAVLDTLEADNLIDRARELGERITGGLAEALSGNNAVQDIRGAGLMIAVELAAPCGELVGKALEQGLLINVTRDNVVRLLPPLTLSDEEADELVARVARVINNA
ncbi:MAG: aspartate aminotransferase family protein [Gammaproteobacteria bacterium]|jgi:acetylornithine aminotransferase|nr:MAG: aspartate aminotransferase family protein [Gammaproteobacteria bacterium]